MYYNENDVLASKAEQRMWNYIQFFSGWIALVLMLVFYVLAKTFNKDLMFIPPLVFICQLGIMIVACAKIHAIGNFLHQSGDTWEDFKNQTNVSSFETLIANLLFLLLPIIITVSCFNKLLHDGITGLISVACLVIIITSNMAVLVMIPAKIKKTNFKKEKKSDEK